MRPSNNMGGNKTISDTDWRVIRTAGIQSGSGVFDESKIADLFNHLGS